MSARARMGARARGGEKVRARAVSLQHVVGARGLVHALLHCCIFTAKKDIKKQCKEQLRTMKTIKLSNSAKWLKKLSVPLPPPLKTLHLENKMILKSTA